MDATAEPQINSAANAERIPNGDFINFLLTRSQSRFQHLLPSRKVLPDALLLSRVHSPPVVCAG